MASQSVTFNYTGAVQQWMVPQGVTQLTIDCYGAEGATFVEGASSYFGGKGGRAKATFSVTPGETLYVYVGGKGLQESPGGGWNGGGQPSELFSGAGGGGASDVRRGGQTLNHRMMVAGGGGGGGRGAGRATYGGAGGGLVGSDANAIAGYNIHGKGGTQTSGGAGGTGNSGAPNGFSGGFGYGGNVRSGSTAHAGGGGGGWYGGGSGSTDDDDDPDYWGGGGGGSGYIHPSATNQLFETGVRSGHGLVIITYEVLTFYVRVNGQVRETDKVYVRVNGQLREVDNIWTRINGALRGL